MDRAAVIIGGGKGSRLVQAGVTTPKLLLRIFEISLLEYTIRKLASADVTRIFFILGHESKKITLEIDRLQKVYKFESSIYVESTAMGTAGYLIQILDELPDEFLLLFGDLYIDFDLNHYFRYFEANTNLDSLVLSRTSDHPEDSNLIETDESGVITKFFFKGNHRQQIYRNRAVVGVFLFRKHFLLLRRKVLKNFTPLDLEQDVLNLTRNQDHVIKSIPLRGIVRDIGTLARLKRLHYELENSPKISNSFNKYAFLDRDGVLIPDIGHRKDQEDLVISRDTICGLKILSNHGYRFLVLTNQPVIARGESSFSDVEKIHGFLDHELKKVGIIIDEYYVCPHHPDKGFKNEIAKYKIECNCRKPATGLIERAFAEIGLEQSAVIFIGDTWRDAEAAKSCGIPFYMTSHYETNDANSLSFEDLAKKIVNLN